MEKFAEFGPPAFFYLLALAAQLSGYTSPGAAIILTALGSAWLTVSLLYRWHVARVRAGKSGVEPTYLILIGTAGAALFVSVALGGVVWQWQRGISPPSTPAAAPAVTQTLAPTKFYSRNDKESLSDLCGALRELLIRNGGDGGGDGVYAKMAELGNYWNVQRGYANNLRDHVDIDGLKEKRISALDSTTSMYNFVYGQNGIAITYAGYSDEFRLLIDDNNRRRISTLQTALNEFGESIVAMERAQAHGDPMLLAQIANSAIPARRDFQEALTTFQKWEFDAVQRIKEFRTGLDQ
jgi:hypothetical protein